MKKDYIHEMTYSEDWKKNVGELGFNVRNDYLFRTLMQRDEQTLRRIVASVMGIDPGTIRDVTVTNPIIPGQIIDDKEVALDVRVLVEHIGLQGNKEIINIEEIDLEMQGFIREGWNERTLIYLCRTFDEINHGVPYENAKPVWQVSFCNFTLFKGLPVFVSNFMLVNIKDVRQVYTDKFKITNINLNAIDFAEEKDKKSGLVYWAKLFKAESWEDFKMIATENPEMENTISSIWQLTQNRNIREQMLRREENELNYRHMVEKTEKANERADKAERKLAENDAYIEELKKQIEELKKNQN